MRTYLCSIALCAVLACASVRAIDFSDTDLQIPEATLDVSGKGFPQCDPTVNQHSGLLTIHTDANKQYFFWAFGPRSHRVDAPVILWMTGGPGCSSSLALLVENGPCHVNLKTGELYNNTYAWNNDAYIIYIDQPAGVGFSKSSSGGSDHNEAEVSLDMVAFLRAFYAKFPELLNNKLYVFGESYGGHYAPATAHRIWKVNRAGETPKIPLVGVATGNGLTVPEVQYKYYAELAYTWCKRKLGRPCVSNETYQSMTNAVPRCVEFIKSCDDGHAFSCYIAAEVCNGEEIEPFVKTGLNVYDIRKECEIKGLCYKFSQVEAFMNRPDVQESLGVPPQKWESCNREVNVEFIKDWFHSFGDDIAEMLNSKEVRVLIYAGDVDFICNFIGNQAWITELEWVGKAAFGASPIVNYTLNGETVATTQSTGLGNNIPLLTFSRIINAGHMVPMDQPASIFSILTKFINDLPW